MPPTNKQAAKGDWNRKKNAIVRNYRKMQKNKPGKFSKSQKNKPVYNRIKKMPFFETAMEEYERLEAAREGRKKIQNAKQRERIEKLRQHAKERREKYKKLTEKTKWGQPVMKGRMEILLEKIQKSVENDGMK